MNETVILIIVIICAFTIIVIGLDVIPIQINDEQKISEIEYQVHLFTNIERQKHGLEPLEYNDDLVLIAKAHSQDMLDRDFFSHDNPDGCDPLCRYEKHSFSCPDRSNILAGENLHLWQYADNIFWQSPEQIGKETIESWMESTGHRKNLLEPDYQSEGIGVVITFKESFITQNFC